jgi:hypothetical protein
MAATYEDTMKTILPHKETQTGTMFTLTDHIKMHIPKGYSSPTPIGFFSNDYDKDEFTRFCSTIVEKKHKDQRDDMELCQFLSEHLDKIDEVAHDVGILDNNSKLLIHGLYHKVIKFQTKLEGLLDNNLLLKDVGNYIFMISGLDQEINFGGPKTNVTTSELVPVCNKATFYMSLQTCSSDKLVTCYSLDPRLITLLSNDRTLSVGRFSFKGGMCNISTVD